MSNHRWNSKNLHEELSVFYNRYRGTMAPINTWTEDLWLRIERAEAEEAASRGKRA